MPYTHTFEFSVGGTDIEGEISFNGGVAPSFKTTAGEELTIAKHKRLAWFMEQLADLTHECGEIAKIEVVKKI